MAHGKWYYFVKSHSERAKTFGLTESFTEQEWESLLENSDKVCVCCKKPFSEIVISADHVIPLSCGGTNTIDNIQILCRKCNTKKNARAIDYRHGEPITYNVTPRKQRGRPKCEKIKIKTLSMHMPINMYEFFKEQASQNKRSVNTEILIAIEERQEKIKKQSLDNS